MTRTRSLQYLGLMTAALIALGESGLAEERETPDTAAKSGDRPAYDASAAAVGLLRVFDEFGRLVKTGSGFVASSPHGERLVTNEHVIRDAASASVQFEECGSLFALSPLVTDEKLDLAVLELRAYGTPTEESSDADEVQRPSALRLAPPPPRGTEVWALGHPGARSMTLTRGIVNAHRSCSELGFPFCDDLPNALWLQTDCTINSGNSGGPLVIETGEVVGVNSFLEIDGENQFFAVSVMHARAMLAVPPSDIIAFPGFDSGDRQVEEPGPGDEAGGIPLPPPPPDLPQLEVAQRRPGTHAVRIASDFARICECRSCEGSGQVVQRDSRYEQRGSQTWHIGTKREKRCSHCDGTGFSANSGLVRVADRLASAISTTRLEDADLLAVAGEKIAEAFRDHGDGLHRFFRETRQSTRRTRPGDSVFFLGNFGERRSLETLVGVVSVVDVVATPRILAIEPIVASATPRQSVAVFGLVAGRVRIGSTEYLVVRNGVVVGLP